MGTFRLLEREARRLRNTVRRSEIAVDPLSTRTPVTRQGRSHRVDVLPIDALQSQAVHSRAFIAIPSASSGSATSNLLAAASESTAASFDFESSSEPSDDDATLVSIAAPLPSTATSSTSSTDSESAAETVDDIDAVDEAITEFDPGPLDDTLLEDLAVSLMG